MNKYTDTDILRLVCDPRFTETDRIAAAKLATNHSQAQVEILVLDSLEPHEKPYWRKVDHFDPKAGMFYMEWRVTLPLPPNKIELTQVDLPDERIYLRVGPVIDKNNWWVIPVGLLNSDSSYGPDWTDLADAEYEWSLNKIDWQPCYRSEEQPPLVISTVENPSL